MPNQKTPTTTLGIPGRPHIRRLHFIGMGGVGMSGIAEVLLNEGYEVSGSDQNNSPAMQYLHQHGAKTFVGHSAENIINADVVIISTAILESNPELVAAHEQGIPVVRRAEMLAALMRFRYGIAISGTHGKTTTTSLVASLLAEGDLDPTYLIGGKLNNAGSNARLGMSQYLVTEADESDASFLHLLPTMTVVTNIDVDHMETYDHNIEKLHETFLKFLHQLPFYGLAIVCLDDPGVQHVLSHVERPKLTYGLHDDADVTARNVRQEGLKTQFTVCYKQEEPFEVVLNLPGVHNVQNALAAIAVAKEVGIENDVIQKALTQFEGVGRRFQVLGNYQHALLIDDYAHHPRELEAVIKAARSSFPDKRLVMVFQPHRYSRTRDLMSEFIDVLSTVDQLFLLDVYPAGESLIVGADSQALSHYLKLNKASVVYVDQHNKLQNALTTFIQPDDILLMCGAGNISQLAHQLIDEQAVS